SDRATSIDEKVLHPHGRPLARRRLLKNRRYQSRWRSRRQDLPVSLVPRSTRVFDVETLGKQRRSTHEGDHSGRQICAKGVRCSQSFRFSAVNRSKIDAECFRIPESPIKKMVAVRQKLRVRVAGLSRYEAGHGDRISTRSHYSK